MPLANFYFQEGWKAPIYKKQKQKQQQDQIKQNLESH